MKNFVHQPVHAAFTGSRLKVVRLAATVVISPIAREILLRVRDTFVHARRGNSIAAFARSSDGGLIVTGSGAGDHQSQSDRGVGREAQIADDLLQPRLRHATTAKALSIEVPPTLLATADEVIE